MLSIVMYNMKSDENIPIAIDDHARTRISSTTKSLMVKIPFIAEILDLIAGWGSMLYDYQGK